MDDALFTLRTELLTTYTSTPFDFYRSEVKEKWANDRKVATPEGEVTVVVPSDEEEEFTEAIAQVKAPEARQSILTQAKLAEIGATMGFKIWVPSVDRARVLDLVPPTEHAFLC